MGGQAFYFIIWTFLLSYLGNAQGDLQPQAESYGLTDTIIKLPSYASITYEPEYSPRFSNKTPKILLWTKEEENNNNWGRWWFDRAHMKKTCPNINCEFTSDRAELYSSDAVIFRGSYLLESDLGYYQNTYLPQYRHPGQRWIYFTLEPPPLAKMDRTRLRGLFNWTMTYRRDSDVNAHYGKLILNALPTPELRRASQSRNYAEGKTKLAAWYVSHCDTDGKREKYVEELQKHVEVDVYGKCGTLTCGGMYSSAQCDQYLNQNYKFYLAFENALCTDYVTEKFFRGLTQDTVPVVFGGANYLEYAPKGSYINALDFPSPKDLAHFLIWLDIDDEEYNKYFDWKRGYSPAYVQTNQLYVCELCRKLVDTSIPSKVYDDMEDFWMTKANCRAWSPNATISN